MVLICTKGYLIWHEGRKFISLQTVQNTHLYKNDIHVYGNFLTHQKKFLESQDFKIINFNMFNLVGQDSNNLMSNFPFFITKLNFV